jgi:alpha-tubulin suppressor-like RCC1 family protein
MSITKNVFRLNKVYELIVAGEWVDYDPEPDTAGTLWSWGDNFCGPIGDNTTINRSSPVQIPGTEWVQMSRAESSSVARKVGKTLWSWGLNSYGQVGDNTIIPRSSPIQIPGNQWSSVSSGRLAKLATKTDGTLWAWGCNARGFLGNNCGYTIANLNDRSSPIQIPGTQWSSVSGDRSAFAIKSDGTLWAWGNNCNGVLTTAAIYGTHRSSPVQIPGTQWSKISTDTYKAFALKTNGTLWAWGYNSGLNPLGDNTTYINRSSPVQIPGTSWTDVTAGGSHTVARKTDGTLWSWGVGAGGKLGNNSTIDRSSPIQIPGTQWVDASLIRANGGSTFGIKTDGTLWAWGLSGGLVTNDTIHRSSPVQVPGTQWIEVYGTMARKSP